MLANQIRLNLIDFLFNNSLPDTKKPKQTKSKSLDTGTHKQAAPRKSAPKANSSMMASGSDDSLQSPWVNNLPVEILLKVFRLAVHKNPNGLRLLLRLAIQAINVSICMITCVTVNLHCTFFVWLVQKCN